MDPVLPGGTFTYTITYSNVGTDAAAGVVVTEAYDPLVTYVSAMPPPDVGTNNVWTIGPLPAGATGTIDVPVQAATVANGTQLTNNVTVRDGLNNTATGTQQTTVASPFFDMDLSDSVDPVVSGGLVEFTVEYGNISGVTQDNVVVNLVYDPNFFVESAMPSWDPGVRTQYTIGTLPPDGLGVIRIRGFFASGATGAIAQTLAQVSNSNGVAYGAESTSVIASPPLKNFAVALVRTARRELWRLRLQMELGEFDAEGQPLEVSIYGPGGIQHVNRLTVPALLPEAGGRWEFLGNVPGNGEVSVKMVPRPRDWIVRLKCIGIDILPPFSAEEDFLLVVRFGDRFFSSPLSAFRDSPTGRSRRGP
jgi:uncharacterized repeat protein (TIGR01451 family)